MFLKDKNFLYTTFRGIRYLLPQFFRKSDGSPTLLEGEKGIFVQVVNESGDTPSISNQGGNDGLLTNSKGILVGSQQLDFNGSSWDRRRNNVESVLLAAVSRTSSTTTPIQTNHNAKGFVLSLTTSAVPANGETLKVRLLSIDPVTNTSRGVCDFDLGAIAVNTSAVLSYYPGLKSSLSGLLQSENGLLSRRFMLQVIHSGSSPWTYSLGCSLIL
jgi:hypothetical protein